MELIKKSDLILIGVMVTGFLTICGFLFLGKSTGTYVVVSVDSVEVARFPLDEDIVYEIKGYEGGINTLIIQNGVAHVEGSSCPDHLCEHMGKISSVGQSIICLPNRVVVEVIEDKKAEYDTVSS